MAEQIDYMEIIKRAAQDTWKYKALWLFGLLMALGSGGGNPGSSGYSPNLGTPGSDLSSRLSHFDWQTYLPLIAAAGLVLFVIAIALVVVGLIARGALISMARDIRLGRSPTVSRGFSEGARYWLRLLAVHLLLALAVIAVLIVVGALLAVAIVGVVVPIFNSAGGSAATGAAVAGGVCGIFAIVAIALVVLIAVVIVISVLGQLADRNVVLLDRRIVDSLQAAWAMLRHRFGDVALWWLVMLVVSAVVGIVIGAAAIALLLPGFGLLVFNPIAAILLVIPAALAAVFLGGVVKAFTSVAWSDWFMIVMPESLAGAYAPAGAPAPSAPPAALPPPATLPPPAAPPAPESLPPRPPA